MLTDTELLNFIYQSTEMGRDGVQCVLAHAQEEPFRQALQQQMTEYEQLNDASAHMLQERGCGPEGVSPVAKASAQLMSAMKTMTDHTTSKIAEMMVQGNTMGMTKSVKHLHDYGQGDARVRDLATKLLKTEEANIEQMKAYL